MYMSIRTITMMKTWASKSETLKDRKEAKDIHEHKNDYNDEDLGLALSFSSLVPEAHSGASCGQPQPSPQPTCPSCLPTPCALVPEAHSGASCGQPHSWLATSSLSWLATSLNSWLATSSLSWLATSSHSWLATSSHSWLAPISNPLV